MKDVKVGNWLSSGHLRFKVRGISIEGDVWVERMRPTLKRWVGTGEWYKLDDNGCNAKYGLQLAKESRSTSSNKTPQGD